MTTKKKTLKPRLAILADHTTILFIKRPKMRHHYLPLTAGQQAQSLSSDQQVNEDALWGMKTADLDRPWQKKLKRALKRTPRRKLARACRTLCGAPNMLPDPKPGWLILLLSLLAAVLDLFHQDLPGVPIVQLKGSLTIPDPLEALLRAVHGPDAVKGKGFRIKRPACIRADIPLGASTPSLAPEDYVGGRAKVNGLKRRFWLPLRCVAFAIAANVPQAVQTTIVERSPLTIPIFCSPVPKLKDRPLVLPIDGAAFLSVDPDMLTALKSEQKATFLVVYSYVSWLRRKKKRQKACRKDTMNFYPRTRNGRFVTTNASDEAKVIALALAIFKQFLRFASKRKWIAAEEARSFLQEAWAQVLPESAPRSLADGEPVAGAWDNPGTFWSFLARYLQEHQRSISLDGAPCERSIIAVAHHLFDETYLIFPREQLAQAYAEYLRAQGIPQLEATNWETALQRTIQDWGIQVKTEKKDITWRFVFYKKGGSADKCKVPCLAFPLAQLPETIMNNLLDWFGEAFGRWLQPQAGRNEAETEKVTETVQNGDNHVS